MMHRKCTRLQEKRKVGKTSMKITAVLDKNNTNGWNIKINLEETCFFTLN